MESHHLKSFEVLVPTHKLGQLQLARMHSTLASPVACLETIRPHFGSFQMEETTIDEQSGLTKLEGYRFDRCRLVAFAFPQKQ